MFSANKPWFQKLGTKMPKGLFLLLGLLLGVLGVVVTGFLEGPGAEFYNWWRTPDPPPPFEPYAAVVVSKESIDFPIPEEFLRGFQDGAPEGKTSLKTRDNHTVDLRYFEDLGSPNEAIRIAKQLLADEECILVVGNSDSTLTAVTLDVFLGSANPPSYILPIATANDLITKARAAGHGGVLRMVPDNASQADIIQQLIAQISTERRIAVFVDEDNPVYSTNLSRDIVSRVREKGGRIVVEEAFGPRNSIYNSLQVLRGESPPEVIVYVGVAHHGLLLIDQLSDLRIQTPVVFTDGCMVGTLIENISRVTNRAFVLSPVAGQGAEKMPTYKPIGRDAVRLASELLSNCSDCTRSSLRKHITETKTSIVVANGAAGEYRFNTDGNNISMRYKVYEITGGTLRLYGRL